MTIKRYTLGEFGGSFGFGSITLIEGETLELDTDAASVQILDRDDQPITTPQLSAASFSNFAQAVQSRARSGHLRQLADGEQTRHEIMQELVQSLNMGSAIKDALHDAGMVKISDVIQFTVAEIKDLTDGIGPARMDELIKALESRGFALKKPAKE